MRSFANRKSVITIVANKAGVETRQRKVILVVAFLCVVVSVVLIVGAVRYFSTYVYQTVYDLCMQNIAGASTAKCRCLGTRMSDRMTTPDYVYRRVVHDEGIREAEYESMERLCGLHPVIIK